MIDVAYWDLTDVFEWPDEVCVRRVSGRQIAVRRRPLVTRRRRSSLPQAERDGYFPQVAVRLDFTKLPAMANQICRRTTNQSPERTPLAKMR